MRILEGVGTLVQLGGLVARLCKMVGQYITFQLTQSAHNFTEHESRPLQNIVIWLCSLIRFTHMYIYLHRSPNSNLIISELTL